MTRSNDTDAAKPMAMNAIAISQPMNQTRGMCVTSSSWRTPESWALTTLAASSTASSSASDRAPTRNSTRYSWCREMGRASSTSSVPRWRSPTMDRMGNPTTITPRIAIAMGWMNPSAMAPERLNRSPPPKLANCSISGLWLLRMNEPMDWPKPA